MNISIYFMTINCCHAQNILENVSENSFTNPYEVNTEQLDESLGLQMLLCTMRALEVKRVENHCPNFQYEIRIAMPTSDN